MRRFGSLNSKQPTRHFCLSWAALLDLKFRSSLHSPSKILNLSSFMTYVPPVFASDEGANLKTSRSTLDHEFQQVCTDVVAVLACVRVRGLILIDTCTVGFCHSSSSGTTEAAGSGAAAAPIDRRMPDPNKTASLLWWIVPVAWTALLVSRSCATVAVPVWQWQWWSE